MIEYVPATLATLLILSQIVVGTYLLSWVSQNAILAYLGVGLYVFSGVFFGVLPIFEFRRKGEVKRGKSYVHTTRLVTTGIYSVVRHPQYVTFMTWAIAAMLLFQHWVVISLGILVIALTYVDLLKADRDGIKKFGNDYRAYMNEVPRANFLAGLVRRVRRKGKRSQVEA
jgi:protein-S-isoprenylcysteine O-methyltransferase Ste14